MSVDLTAARRWIALAGALAGLLAITVSGWLGYRAPAQQWPVADATPMTGSRADSSPQAGAERASSPPRTARPAAAAAAAASGAAPLRWPLWEFRLREPLPPRDPPLTPPSWRLIGATQSGGVWQIIIVRQGKAVPEAFKVGDRLPGDYRIEAINEEDVTLVQRRRRMVLSYIGY